MKKLAYLILMLTLVVSCKNEAPKVLLYIVDGSMQFDFMIDHEVNVMQEILNQNGFDVIVATQSGETLESDSTILSPDIRLGDVNVDDYSGFIIPCMVVGDSEVDSDEITFVREVADAGKPLAAQVGGVAILGEAGILDGKRFAFLDEEGNNAQMYPFFGKGIYSGRGVVQDGQIITSGTCPWMAETMGYQDGTEELTGKLVSIMKEGSQ